MIGGYLKLKMRFVKYSAPFSRSSTESGTISLQQRVPQPMARPCSQSTITSGMVHYRPVLWFYTMASTSLVLLLIYSDTGAVVICLPELVTLVLLQSIPVHPS